MTSSTLAYAVSEAESVLDLDRVRADFPILSRLVGGKPLAYLDNAATSQKPKPVIDAVSHYYLTHNANVHRGVHALSEEATNAYEGARDKVRAFVGAKRREEIIFTRGATEAVNLVAQAYGRDRLKPGEEVLISELEHHSNIVPWQLLCQQTGASLKVAPINDRGEVILEAYRALLSERTKIVALNHVSNALGTISPVKEMTEAAHRVGAVVLLDGAQAAPHLKIDVQEIGCDFYAFSGHKMYAPTGIGALYGRRELLEQMSPYQGGGDMILIVSFDKTIYNELPYKFEAGTPNIAGVVGLGAAIDYLEKIGLDTIAAYENELLDYGTELLKAQPGLRLIGEARQKASVLSFVLDYAHPHDVGTILSHEGLAVRTGHHCAQPVMAHFDVPATVRASLAFYNTKEELDALVKGLEKVREVFA